RVVRPKLGILPYNVRDIRGVQLPVQEGVLIGQLVPEGSAAAAGMRELSQDANGEVVLGDIITAIDGERVRDNNDLFRILDKHQFNDVVQVEIYREGRRTTVPVRLLPEQRRGILRR
ncbi:MAG TPA: PDZ domain-containing protein, partial [Pyrinomonadaceae bacterium]